MVGRGDVREGALCGGDDDCQVCNGDRVGGGDAGGGRGRFRGAC